MKILVNSILIVTFILFATMASALTILNGNIEVGEVDGLMACAELGNSGVQTEVDFINLYLSSDYVIKQLIRLITDILSNLH